jgi:hypothetical protein
MKRISESQLADLERKVLAVQSRFSGVTYAIEKRGRGMWIIANNSEIPVCADNVVAFAQEIIEVWNLHGKGD